MTIILISALIGLAGGIAWRMYAKRAGINIWTLKREDEK